MYTTYTRIMVQNTPNNSLLVLCNEIKHFFGCFFNSLFYILHGCSSMDNVDFNNLPFRNILVECLTLAKITLILQMTTNNIQIAKARQNY